MTGVTHLRMDLLHTEDQMDLASSPAMATYEIDFELDDACGLSAEPNQDLMSQDDPEQPYHLSKTVTSTNSDHADDDLMLDEETITELENQTEPTDLNMDKDPDEPALVDEDDDILYEDDEELQGLEGQLAEQSKEQNIDDIDGEGQHSTSKARIGSPFENELPVADGVDPSFDIASRRAGDAEGTLEQQKITSVVDVGTVATAVTAEDEDDDQVSIELNEDSLSHEGADLVPGEDIFANDVVDGNAELEHKRADAELDKNLSLQAEVNQGVADESKFDASKTSDNGTEFEQVASDLHVYPPAENSVVNEESVDEPVHTSLLHTVKIHYLETEMCLFPPTDDDDTEMFFLQDVSLAHESLDKMLGACRDVLADAISPDDELVLDIASLGLHISEDSRHATQITLAQIVEVYLALGQNDITSVQPLYCSLSSRVCLASQYAYLHSAAKEGKTLTRILEENSMEIGQSGENREDSVENEYAEANQHRDIEPQRKDKFAQQSSKIYVPAELHQELVQEPVAGEFEDATDGKNDDLENGPTNGSLFASDEDKPDECRVGETQNGQQSASPAVKGDPNDLKGDYELSFDLCLKPDDCYCSACANTSTDDAALVAESNGNEELAEDLFGDFTHVAADPDNRELNVGLDDTGFEKPEAESNLQESISSRTLEAENEHVHEDMFSEDADQTFKGENDDGDAKGYHDELEDFGVDVHNDDDATSEAANADNALRGLESENHDLNLDHTALGSIHNSTDFGISGQTQQNNLNGAQTGAGNDDDFLNLDDDGEEEDGGQDKHEHDHSVTSLGHHKASDNKTDYSGSDLNGSLEILDSTKGRPGQSKIPDGRLSSETLESHSGTSPHRQNKNNMTSGQSIDDAPSTPSGGKNSSKRKAHEDEDDFDLFDTATPEKKRRRPSP